MHFTDLRIYNLVIVNLLKLKYLTGTELIMEMCDLSFVPFRC